MNDGGPAFPVQDLIKQREPGMTLLDYFAGQALASYDAVDELNFETARWCYSMAAAMLAERKKVMARK